MGHQEWESNMISKTYRKVDSLSLQGQEYIMTLKDSGVLDGDEININ